MSRDLTSQALNNTKVAATWLKLLNLLTAESALTEDSGRYHYLAVQEVMGEGEEKVSRIWRSFRSPLRLPMKRSVLIGSSHTETARVERTAQFNSIGFQLQLHLWSSPTFRSQMVICWLFHR